MEDARVHACRQNAPERSEADEHPERAIEPEAAPQQRAAGGLLRQRGAIGAARAICELGRQPIQDLVHAIELHERVNDQALRVGLRVVVPRILLGNGIDAAERYLAVADEAPDERLPDLDGLHALDVDAARLAREQAALDLDARAATPRAEVAVREQHAQEAEHPCRDGSNRDDREGEHGYGARNFVLYKNEYGARHDEGQAYDERNGDGGIVGYGRQQQLMVRQAVLVRHGLFPEHRRTAVDAAPVADVADSLIEHIGTPVSDERHGRPAFPAEAAGPLFAALRAHPSGRGARAGIRLQRQRGTGGNRRLAHKQLGAHALGNLELQIRHHYALVRRTARRVDGHGAHAEQALDDRGAVVHRLHAGVRHVHALLRDDARVEAELPLVEHVPHVAPSQGVHSREQSDESGQAEHHEAHDQEGVHVDVALLERDYKVDDALGAARQHHEQHGSDGDYRADPDIALMHLVTPPGLERGDECVRLLHFCSYH